MRVLIVGNGIQAFSTVLDVILQNIHPIDRRYRHERIPFVLQLTSSIPFPYHFQLASQHFGKEVAVTAGRFKETTVNTFSLLFDQIQHGIDFSIVGEHLAVFFHALFGFDLLPFCHLLLLTGHVVFIL